MSSLIGKWTYVITNHLGSATVELEIKNDGWFSDKDFTAEWRSSYGKYKIDEDKLHIEVSGGHPSKFNPLYEFADKRSAIPWISDVKEGAATATFKFTVNGNNLQLRFIGVAL